MSLSLTCFLVLTVALSLGACGSAPRRPPPKPTPSPPVALEPVAPAPVRPADPAPESGAFKPGKDSGPSPEEIPANLDQLPEIVPRVEPRSAYGNPKSYEVFGKRYQVLDSAEGFREIGIASWYGKKFHGKRTSSGETYDMFVYSAAHKSLPLPSYVRVTNLRNGKNVVVRVNDRGPFHAGRIIDLSYAAAAKLELLGGTGPVEIESITPGRDLPPAPRPLPEVAAVQPRFLQVAAFSDPINAVSLREELQRLAITNVVIRVGTLDRLQVHRVLVGPFADGIGLLNMRARLIDAGHEADPRRD